MSWKRVALMGAVFAAGCIAAAPPDGEPRVVWTEAPAKILAGEPARFTFALAGSPSMVEDAGLLFGNRSVEAPVAMDGYEHSVPTLEGFAAARTLSADLVVPWPGDIYLRAYVISDGVLRLSPETSIAVLEPPSA